MTRLSTAVAMSCLLAASAASADPGHRGHDRGVPPGLAGKPYGMPPGHAKKLWLKGERIPAMYIAPRYYLSEPRVYHLAPPPRGHRWVIVDGDAYLVQVASGLVTEVIVDLIRTDVREPQPVVAYDRDDRWRQRYVRTYTYDDDPFYRECHQTVDPAGVVAGAVIGGLIGNAVGHGGGRTGATIAGVVAGGALGAALTRNLDCEDRGYVYKTYSEGFNAGRPNGVYQWRNPGNGHYGEFRVADYYKDPDGFRCANYTQKIYVDGRPQAASGRACQQPDGTWAIVS